MCVVQGAVVHWPRYSRIMDFELEFGVFLGRRGANISAERAREHIFGFTIFNDFSARDTQLIEMQGGMGPTKAKSFDGANIMGPWIVTADEIPDPYSLAMAARVNGQTWTSGDSSGMLHSFEEMIAYISRDEIALSWRVHRFWHNGQRLRTRARPLSQTCVMRLSWRLRGSVYYGMSWLSIPMA